MNYYKKYLKYKSKYCSLKNQLGAGDSGTIINLKIVLPNKKEKNVTVEKSMNTLDFIKTNIIPFKNDESIDIPDELIGIINVNDIKASKQILDESKTLAINGVNKDTIIVVTRKSLEEKPYVIQMNNIIDYLIETYDKNTLNFIVLESFALEENNKREGIIKNLKQQFKFNVLNTILKHNTQINKVNIILVDFAFFNPEIPQDNNVFGELKLNLIKPYKDVFIFNKPRDTLFELSYKNNTHYLEILNGLFADYSLNLTKYEINWIISNFNITESVLSKTIKETISKKSKNILIYEFDWANDLIGEKPSNLYKYPL